MDFGPPNKHKGKKHTLQKPQKTKNIKDHIQKSKKPHHMQIHHMYVSKMYQISITFDCEEIETPNISLAHITIRILNVYINVWTSGSHASNLTLFLWYQSDHITHPRIKVHSFFHLRRFINPSQAGMKVPKFSCRAPEILHSFKISIQVCHENLQVNKMWEFDSITILQKGHRACCWSMIPLATRKSPVFNFSKPASHSVNFALGGTKLFQIKLVMPLGKIRIDTTVSGIALPWVGVS